MTGTTTQRTTPTVILTRGSTYKNLANLAPQFAAQVLADIKPLGITEDKLNIGGGGIALGHPIGASGARVLVTLIHQLHRTGGKRGVCSLCLGGGNAVSMLIEMA